MRADGRCIDARCLGCARRVPWFAFFGNLSLTFFKVIVGFLGGSSALVADGIHSFTDVIGTTVIIVSCRISDRPADEEHPYGHGKAEFISSTFIYLVLLVLAVFLFGGGLIMIVHWELHAPSLITLLGGLVSILYNVIMYGLGQCAGRRTHSPALLANSFENRADAISSIAVVLGIALAVTVHPICDPLAAMAVGVIIFVNCMVELRKALDGLMDRSLPAGTIERIRRLALNQRGIAGVTFVKSRSLGNGFWLDIGVEVPAETPVDDADAIATSLRSELMRRSSHLQAVEVFVAPQTARG